MSLPHLACVRCGTQYPATHYARKCPRCLPITAGLTVVCDQLEVQRSREALRHGPRSIWRYAHSLPVPASEAITMGEGLTPLIPIERIGAELGLGRIYGKCEFANPTGSFKDRLASSAISAARSLFRAQIIACSSTGNAGAAAAAYAARAGLPCIVFATDGASPMVAQMQAYGAIIALAPTKADRWMLLGEGVERLGWFPTSPFFGPPVGSNPFGIEGYKSLSYEIAEGLGWEAPEWIVLPVCYGDALYGMWKGFNELLELGWVESMPRFAAAEIYGSLTAAFASGEDVLPVAKQDYETLASSITAQQSTYQALAVLRRTSGRPVQVAEDELTQAASALSSREGLHVEFAAAAAVAAAATLRRENTIEPDDRVVCLLTAAGLKNPSASSSMACVAKVPPDLDRALDIVLEVHGIDLKTGTRAARQSAPCDP